MVLFSIKQRLKNIEDAADDAGAQQQVIKLKCVGYIISDGRYLKYDNTIQPE
ncbi:MAG: hypothetical protein MRK02_06060 [Candidatus Scalindua sp.]|nr:hypothetical protein [Candidatus Scalindua sp.]